MHNMVFSRESTDLTGLLLSSLNFHCFLHEYVLCDRDLLSDAIWEAISGVQP